MPLQFQTQGGVKKLLIHDSATNPQAVGDLQGECCCLGYVRLTQCIDTGFKCGNCPDSGTESGCDEDGDGSVDYPHVIYIDEGIWEEKAKTFTPSDCVGGGTWSSLAKSGVVLVTSGACAGYQSAGTVSSLPASCQGNIRSLGMFKEFEGDQVPPGIPANPGGSGAKNLINYANCQTACEDDYREVTACEDGNCGLAFSEFQCPADGKKFYIPCGMLEDFFGAGQVDNNIGKVIKLNNLASGPCVKLTATRICGAALPYDCVGGTWTKGGIDGEARIATSIVGSASDDCCTCQGVTCGCVRACKDDLSSTYSISITGVASDGNPNVCACGSGDVFSKACDTVEDSGGTFSSPPSGGCAFTNTNCCQNQGLCAITSFPSVTVEHVPGAASCFAGEFTSDGFSGSPVARSGCNEQSDGTGQIGGGINQPCINLGTFMTTPVVAFKCIKCDSNDPCACPNCNGNCDPNNCAPDGGGGPFNCLDEDPDNDNANECRSCEGNYEDDFFIYSARLFCPTAVGDGSGSRWSVEITMTWPDGGGPSLHGPLRENDNREFAANNIYSRSVTAVKDDDSEDPTGDYTITSAPATANDPCTYSSFEAFISDFASGGIANSIWGGAKVTVS